MESFTDSRTQSDDSYFSFSFTDDPVFRTFDNDRVLFVFYLLANNFKFYCVLLHLNVYFITKIFGQRLISRFFFLEILYVRREESRVFL